MREDPDGLTWQGALLGVLVGALMWLGIWWCCVEVWRHREFLMQLVSRGY